MIGGVDIPNAEEKFVEMSHGTTRYVEAGDGYPTILLHGVGYAEGAGCGEVMGGCLAGGAGCFFE